MFLKDSGDSLCVANIPLGVSILLHSLKKESENNKFENSEGSELSINITS